MVVAKNKMIFIVGGLLLGILIAAMDNTIVATAMATIVGDLGGLEKFVWVTSAYMVAEMAGMPIFGKLSDMYGRKRFFLFGLLVFLLGSVLCGFAESITQLIIFRVIQGIGGGALVPIAFTIMYDIFPVEKRGQMGGLFGAVFGLSSIFGPLLGAYITDNFGWHWIFYINLPLGILAFVLIMLAYKESPRHTKLQIDWWGAATLVGAIVCLMFALELGGKEYAWSSVVIISLFIGFVVLALLFLYIERIAAEAIISFEMFKKRLYSGSVLVGIFSGASFIVATVFIPIYIQGVQGGSATNSGMLLLPMMLGTVASAQLGGMLANKFSYRNVMFGFMLILILGIVLLTTLQPETSQYLVTLYMIITGLGIGASFSTLSMASIHHFDTGQRGQATSTMSFLRSLGMTIGITAFGVIQRNLFSKKLADAFADGNQGAAGGSFGDPRDILDPAKRALLPKPILDKITRALSESITSTFMWTIIAAVLGLAFVFYMSDERMVVYKKGEADS